MGGVILALPLFEGPDSNLAPAFLFRLARFIARTTASTTCTFSTGHFDSLRSRVAGHLMRMLGKWPISDRYIIEPWACFYLNGTGRDGNVIIFMPSTIL